LSELIEKSGELIWLDTDAGHLILMPAAARPHWSGIEPPPDGREIAVRFRSNAPDAPATDYDRACDIDDYVGVLDVASSWGVVLGQEPLPATWRSMRDGSVLIARLYTSEIGTPSHLPDTENLKWTTVGFIDSDGALAVLFDSTEVGWKEPVFPSLDVGLPAGHYAVEHATFANDVMELWLVRLRRCCG
jgi:hypothetical protein